MALTRRSLIGAAAAFAVVTSGAARPQPKGLLLADVIDRHTTARGGRSALDAVQGQDVNLTIVENGSPLDAHYRCTSEPSYRIDILPEVTTSSARGSTHRGLGYGPQPMRRRMMPCRI